VLHQDIKPTNFLIRVREDRPDHPDLLLSDFGIAKLTSATASASQNVRGTPTYMAPEQWDGHPVAASDQYALAIMLYELLVGHPPFQGGPGQVMRQHFLTLPPAPSLLNGRLSPAIDVVLLRALAKQPDGRFASMTAFVRAFQEAMHSDADLHATLAISQAEAESGTTRDLTLPGGRQVSVTVPAGVGDGTTLRLEGQGMPYYAGGPPGPLVLTIAIPPQASPLPLSPNSADLTLAVSRPEAELKLPENPSVPPTPPALPDEQKLLVPASSEGESASTILATNATLLPAEITTPARHTTSPLELARSATPPAGRLEALVAAKPARPGASRRLVLLGLAGLVVVALAGGLVWFSSPHGSATTTGGFYAAPATAGSVTEYSIPTASSHPNSIVTGRDGNLWFTESVSNKIGRISPAGIISEYPIPTASSSPQEIAAGPDGNLWFTESVSNKIGRISPGGAISEYPIPTANSSPQEIAAGPDGNLWFTEPGSNKIGRITSGK
jgi:sugar lactone lactonase YvrE